MKQILSLLLIILLLIVAACNKPSSNTDRLFIRIENATTENFEAFSLGASDFGEIQSGDTTNYVLCKDIFPVPFANLITINQKAIYIVDIVPTPYLSNGKYLMKVVDDTSALRYAATFVQE